MTVSWVSPKLGSIILLKEGFVGTKNQHYGIVLGRFKINASENRFLIYAPGTSVKEGFYYDLKCGIFLSTNDTANQSIGCKTYFYFDPKFVRIGEYPSDQFLQSYVPQNQADQVSCFVDEILDLKLKIRIWEHGASTTMGALIGTYLKSLELDTANIRSIKSQDEPAEFVSSK